MNDPWEVFSVWYAQAEADPETEAEVVALATATKDGRPSVRMALYRGIREGGLSFFTNYESRKGRELAENPFAAMTFYWERLDKQVRIEGRVERLSAAESDAYFRARPRESQVAAIVSRQSEILIDEDAYLNAMDALDQAAKGQSLPRPENWGGFKLLPSNFEFWLRGDYRRHHRTRYDKTDSGWSVSRLYP
ncbi:MAG TPA: pyridoxamine 5'-phosphate oxidase [Terriglobia bacterium]|nr:pyridoxamine 5'-phosphate oxidase [Terriglobia bacterium]